MPSLMNLWTRPKISQRKWTGRLQIGKPATKMVYTSEKRHPQVWNSSVKPSQIRCQRNMGRHGRELYRQQNYAKRVIKGGPKRWQNDCILYSTNRGLPIGMAREHQSRKGKIKKRPTYTDKTKSRSLHANSDLSAQKSLISGGKHQH